MNTTIKRGLRVLITGATLQLFLGVVYIWGMFVLPVSETFNWYAGYARLTSSFMLGHFPLGMFLGGKLAIRMGATKTTLLGGTMMGAGVFLASLTPLSMPWLIFITYGAFAGTGAGIAYITVLAAVPRWFPRRRGIATGICVGAFALSISIFAPIVQIMLYNFEVQTVFMMLAAVIFAATLVFAPHVRYPNKEEAEEISREYTKFTETAKAGTIISTAHSVNFSTKEMIKQKEFYVITFSLLLGTVAFMVVNPSAATLSLYRGLDVGFATYLVMIMGFSNAFGRFLVPAFSSKVRSEIIVLAIMVANTLAAIGLIFAEGTLFVLLVTIIPISFGAILAVFPLIVGDYFGTANVGANYGIVGAGFSVSALLMPGLIALLGGYTIQFMAVAFISFAGILNILLLMKMGNKKKL
ncbi:MAG: MFS transporter [Defluviitaleaceae bacterium]|nr:MFS transporter [Defluviitaleaceae bacterium]